MANLPAGYIIRLRSADKGAAVKADIEEYKTGYWREAEMYYADETPYWKMQCSNCGETVEETDYVFCPYCGSRNANWNV